MIHALQFLPTPPDQSLLYAGSYDLAWVTVSVLLVILASYAALKAALRVEYLQDTRSKLIWTVVGVLTLGVGIWAMHFIGMLALNLPCGIQYDPFTTLISMLPGMLAGGMALDIARKNGKKILPSWAGSILFGAGVGTMHYTGMAAMRLEGFVRYDPGLFILSIAVAIGLSYIALRLKNALMNSDRRYIAVIAVIIGSAVSGMHYTAMAAAYFVRGNVTALPPSLFTVNNLAILVAVTTTLLALAALVLVTFSRNREVTNELRASEERWKFALEGAGDGVWDWNPQTNECHYSKRWKQIIGYAEHEFPGSRTTWIEHLHPDDKDRFLSAVDQYLTGAQPVFVVEYRLRCKDGAWKWILARGKLISRDADGKPQRMIGTHTDITERKTSEEKIQYLAFYDSLTRLPNRRLLMDRLQQALAFSKRSGKSGSLLFIDLDNFKTLNDTLGHEIGDQLLQQVAQRLASCVRESDTVARLGGDEFVVMLENLSEHPMQAAAQTEIVGNKILVALSQIYVLSTNEYEGTTSIGATLFMGHEKGMDELMKQADIAMYQAKKAGRNALCFFDPKMQVSISSRASLERELRNALEKREFLLLYQIQVDNLRRPLGAEVLLRWNHPEHGLMSPMEFIPLAEDTGLIVPIGIWVLQTACAQLAEWQKNALTRGLVLAVNVSARQLRKPDFVIQVQRVLRESKANPALLKLELTESAVMENVDDTISKMLELKKLGVSFSMDDFGTGYSSLQYLKRLPLNQIKIDQSFVNDITTDPNDAAIVQTIIAMTGAMGLHVIAEGVETQEQREFLELRGCHAFQGYLFSKPVPLNEFERLLNTHATGAAANS